MQVFGKCFEHVAYKLFRYVIKPDLAGFFKCLALYVSLFVAKCII